MVLDRGPQSRAESFCASVKFLANGEHRHRISWSGAELVNRHCVIVYLQNAVADDNVDRIPKEVKPLSATQ